MDFTFPDGSYFSFSETDETCNFCAVFKFKQISNLKIGKKKLQLPDNLVPVWTFKGRIIGSRAYEFYSSLYSQVYYFKLLKNPPISSLKFDPKRKEPCIGISDEEIKQILLRDLETFNSDTERVRALKDTKIGAILSQEQNHWGDYWRKNNRFIRLMDDLIDHYTPVPLDISGVSPEVEGAMKILRWEGEPSLFYRFWEYVRHDFSVQGSFIEVKKLYYAAALIDVIEGFLSEPLPRFSGMFLYRGKPIRKRYDAARSEGVPGKKNEYRHALEQAKRRK